jgi:hypothetical protein
MLAAATLSAAPATVSSSIPAATASPLPIADDFGITVRDIVRLKRTVRLTMGLRNPSHAENLFLHLEANEADAQGIVYMPSMKPGAASDPATHFLKTDGSETMELTLAFPVDASASAAVLVVGEAVSPFRQAAVPVDLTLGHPPLAPTPESAAPAAPGERVIATYETPILGLGSIVLKDGAAGPDGHGWSRIYTDWPDASLDQIAQTMAHPNQVWANPDRLFFVAKLSASRALGLEVARGEVWSAKLLTKATFPHAVGPGTPYPNRVYLKK